MSLDVTGVAMATAIVAAIPQNLQPPTPEGQASQLAYFTSISQGIITYLIANTQVSTTDFAAVVSSVISPGVGACSGTLTSIGTGNIS